jgi:hypothetical protein
MLQISPDPEPFREHVLIDFSGLEKAAIERASKKLKARAEAREWLFRAHSG